MDNAVVCSAKGKPTAIGQDVTIMPGAVVQSATIGDGCMIGMGAVVQAGAVIGPDCFIDAGAVVTPGTTVPAGQLWTGVPAKFLRALSADEMSYLRSTAVTSSALGLAHAAQLAKDTPTLEHEQEVRLLKMESGFAPNKEVSTPDADVIEYYKLTSQDANDGLFRGKEYDLTSELAQREAEEVAADAAEEAYYAALARQKRVAEALKLVAAATRQAAAGKAVADLEARDPEGAAVLRNIVSRVASAAALPAGHPEKEDVLRAIAQVLPPAPADTQEEHKAAVAGTFDSLVSHAKTGMGFLSARPLGGEDAHMQ